MNNTNQRDKIITTNVRFPESQWLQVKVEAAEMGFSINQYINRIIEQSSMQKRLALTIKDNKSPAVSFWNLPKIAKKWSKRKVLEMSEEDKIIYA
ncbi:hypothetical protein L6255_01070 [Candidatus Parcubacteria bacterium]|nr:hypothetical protein [Patescibacteria group bacterium]MBU4381294.1 hypothetical protein [Patescibacteria group bacterium]MCG2689011.1 hypothetical protein [Candidatus Parcubacteria bacterium]